MGAGSNNPWWKSTVIYQVYPRSFCDSNGDGIGDLQGIISRLDYLQKLGIGAIWLSPVYRSPQDDNGYDIADYEDIDPIFGTMDDMDELIREAKRRDIRIIMDLVLNHSSDEHRWFLEAKKSRDNPYHDYYVWRDGIPGTPPNGMRASFGGSAWEWVPELGQYYLHQFSVKQPDLNWENPKLRRELYDMINRWTDRGIGGYRLDVVDHLGKVPDEGLHKNGPMLHAYIREMSEACFQRAELVTVGEAWSADIRRAKLYSRPDGKELSMVFQFEHMTVDRKPDGDKWELLPMDFTALKRLFTRWQQELAGCGWNSLFWENHDLPRCVSRFGDDGQYRERSAKVLAMILFGMQGTAYVYQGQELGMTDAPFELEDYRDIEIRNMVSEKRAAGWSEERILGALHAMARDNARTPMQWDGGRNAGFTEGTPWIRVNPNYPEINAAEQVHREDSVFACYRTLIRLRKERPVFTEGSFEPLFEDDSRLWAYRRQSEEEELLVLCNCSSGPVSLPVSGEEAKALFSGEVLMSSIPADEARRINKSDGAVLQPWEGYMIYEHQ